MPKQLKDGRWRFSRHEHSLAGNIHEEVAKTLGSIVESLQTALREQSSLHEALTSKGAPAVSMALALASQRLSDEKLSRLSHAVPKVDDAAELLLHVLTSIEVEHRTWAYSASRWARAWVKLAKGGAPKGRRTVDLGLEDRTPSAVGTDMSGEDLIAFIDRRRIGNAKLKELEILRALARQELAQSGQRETGKVEQLAQAMARRVRRARAKRTDI